MQRALVQTRDGRLIIVSMNKSCLDSAALFDGRHFDRSIIILCVRWYVTDKLSYRDLVDQDGGARC